jgi:hypothetical protein
MTELSPAAQAVLNAASEVYWDWGDMVPSASHTIAAAALRAAAGCLQELPESSDYCFWASSHEHGLERGVEKLNAIATELEAQ